LQDERRRALAMIKKGRARRKMDLLRVMVVKVDFGKLKTPFALVVLGNWVQVKLF
jgi:hypothetical protein